GRARRRRGRRHRDGQARGALSRPGAPREGALRISRRRVPRERRVRDGEGRGGARMAGRGAGGGRDPARHPPRGRRRHHHLLRARRGAAGARMRRPHPFVAIALAILLAVPPAVLAKKGSAGERDLGRQFLLEARSELPLAEDPALTDYINGLGRKLVESLGPQEFDYRFFVIESPILNAFAVPGGYVFLFTGLIARANTEDEIVGVLGHEIGHVHAHHIVRLQQAGTMWTAASLLGMLLAAVNPVLAAGRHPPRPNPPPPHPPPP